jgi:hypothetical protein
MTLQNDWSRSLTMTDALARFYAKPYLKLSKFSSHNWVCVKPELNGRWTQAYGATPQEAYANWAAKEYK